MILFPGLPSKSPLLPALSFPFWYSFQISDETAGRTELQNMAVVPGAGCFPQMTWSALSR